MKGERTYSDDGATLPLDAATPLIPIRFETLLWQAIHEATTSFVDVI